MRERGNNSSIPGLTLRKPWIQHRLVKLMHYPNNHKQAPSRIYNWTVIDDARQPLRLRLLGHRPQGKTRTIKQLGKAQGRPRGQKGPAQPQKGTATQVLPHPKRELQGDHHATYRSMHPCGSRQCIRCEAKQLSCPSGVLAGGHYGKTHAL